MNDQPTGAPEKGPSLTDILNRACEEPTLLDAISFISVCDTERAVAQARRNNFESWETCSKYLIGELLKKWTRKRAPLFRLNDAVIDNQTRITYYIVHEPADHLDLESAMPCYVISRDPRNPADIAVFVNQLTAESGRFSKLLTS